MIVQTEIVRTRVTGIEEGRVTADGVELDGGPQGRGPERFCIVTRTVRPVSDLIRFVAAPDGEVTPDIKGKLPGRGVWVTATRRMLDEAIKRRAFGRSFKRDIRLPADLGAATDRLLERSALDALAMAVKARRVVQGFARVAGALEHDDLTALIHAAEASPDGIRKLAAVSRRLEPVQPPVVIETLTSAQLDLALGRPNVIHAALLAGPAGGTFLSRWRRLERFRTGEVGDRGNQAGNAASH
jgi:hypothetical protein